MTADASSPEAAGIFRIFQAKVDPLPDPLPDTAAAAPAAGKAIAVPLPPSRPAHQRVAQSAGHATPGFALSARSR
jgi:hypothetical protein